MLFIAFYVGKGWTIQTVLAICLVNYMYKFVIAIVLTPLIYLMHALIIKYLGAEVAGSMQLEAMGKNAE